VIRLNFNCYISLHISQHSEIVEKIVCREAVVKGLLFTVMQCVAFLLLVIPDLINKLASVVDAAVSGARAKSPTSQCATPKSFTDFDNKSSSSLDYSADTRDLPSPTPDSLRRYLTLVNEPSDQVEMTTPFEVNLAIGC
jgi:hypothetical protein